MVLLERALYLVIVLGTLVFIHELGHFLAAKLFGIRVEVFSLGFGPRLAGFRHKDTDYRVALIPLGGYVKMAGEYLDPAAGAEDQELFTSKPRWQRLVVMFGGPAMNVLLAVLLWWGIFIHGDYEIDLPQGPPMVQAVLSESPAQRAGIKAGDRLLSIDGVEIDGMERYGEELIFRPGRRVDYVVDRRGERLTLQVEIGQDPVQGVGFDGVRLGYDIVITQVVPGSRAEQAGIRPGDRLLLVEGRPPVTLQAATDTIKSRPEQPLELTLGRDGEEITVTVTPARQEDGTGLIGIGWGYPTRLVRYGPLPALGRALGEARKNVALLVRTVGSLLRMRLGVEVLSGPLEIARVSQSQAQYGVIPFLRLMAFISINLGIFNLLPIPVLDGGNIVILLVESSLRRDLSPAIKERVLQFGFLLLLVFAVAVISIDVRKALISARQPAAAAESAAPAEDPR